MKRSEINHYIREAEAFFAEHSFFLPSWAYWDAEQWMTEKNLEEIHQNMLGWDITDFGSSDFIHTGLLLFTIRNGNPQRDLKPYAEKIMVVGESQETPMHFHWRKMEDIINRGGGNLVLELSGSDKEEKPISGPVQVSISGIQRTVEPGEQVILSPGESICLEQKIYHRFYGEKGCGKVLVGEVSMVNDDNDDNRFLNKQDRFSSIIEDEPPYRLLATDYTQKP